MSNLPMVKWLMKQDTALRAPLYKEWLTQVDKDPILNDMLNGRYNPSAVNSTNVSNTFKTLTSLDYTRLNLESIDSIKTAMNDYGLGDMKDKSFMLLLSKKM